MYISSEITRVSIQWTVICRHEYERISRPKWRIDFDYKCGAKMAFEEIPDDMIQCLILGAYNSHKEIETNLGTVIADTASPDFPFAEWKDLQPLFVS